MKDMRQHTTQILFFTIIAVLLVYSCRKEKWYSGDDAHLSFSTDTLFFDTVFTTIGSTTRSFTVHNPQPLPIKISSIDLGLGDQSPFRMNVNGRVGTSISTVELEPGDSLYIFVEVTVDPQNVNSPVFVHDSIIFNVNGTIQDVDLVAWGQDVHIFDGAIIESQEWNNDKPYLIIHSLFVDTAQTLTINEGTKIYLFAGSTIYTAGKLLVKGTIDNPVVFRGARLEKMYEDIPGQWGGIYLLNGSRGNSIDHAVIRNGTFGIHMGNLFSADSAPDLQITNTIIKHMNWAGISSIGGVINGGNLLVTDCGFYGLLLTAGGNYSFGHLTLANYWLWSNRTTPALVLTDYYTLGDSILVTGDLVRAEFYNSIIYGDNEQEIDIEAIDSEGSFNYLFDHCLLKTPEDMDFLDSLHFQSGFLNIDPGFVDYRLFDFHPDSLAFILDKGDSILAQPWPYDLEGNSRFEDSGPDLGAYERVDSLAVR